MHFIFISTLFPNSANPTRALYNLRHMSALRDLGHQVDIIAPVPWFPGLSLIGRKYPPKREIYEGFDVRHPRFPAPPGMLVHKHHLFYRRAVAPLVREQVSVNGYQLSELEEGKSSVSRRPLQPAAGDFQPAPRSPTRAATLNQRQRSSTSEATFNPFNQRRGLPPLQPSTTNHQPSRTDLQIIVGFAYPDAVAMVPVCRALRLDFSIFVLGSDFRVRVNQPKFKKMVMKTLMETPGIFCPGQALRADMIAAGLDATRIHSFNNGVDTTIFHP